MRHIIIEAARQFSAQHFIDARLGQQQFTLLISEALSRFAVLEDKVAFLSEVIRMSRLFLDESQSVLNRMEEQNLSKTGIESLY